MKAVWMNDLAVFGNCEGYEMLEHLDIWAGRTRNFSSCTLTDGGEKEAFFWMKGKNRKLFLTRERPRFFVFRATFLAGKEVKFDPFFWSCRFFDRHKSFFFRRSPFKKSENISDQDFSSLSYQESFCLSAKNVYKNSTLVQSREKRSEKFCGWPWCRGLNLLMEKRG